MSDEFGSPPSRTRPRSGAAPRRARRRPSTKLLTAKFAALSTAGALAIGGWLAVQMASGSDPALGPKAKTGKTKAAAPATVTPSTTGSTSSSTPTSQSQSSTLAPVTTRAS